MHTGLTGTCRTLITVLLVQCFVVNTVGLSAGAIISAMSTKVLVAGPHNVSTALIL